MDESSPHRFLVPLSFAMLLAVWGYSWIFLKIALEDAGPVTFAAQRTFFASLILLAALPVLRRRFLPQRMRETMALGLVQTTAFVTLSQLALVEGGVGRSAVLVFTMPFWTVIFAAFVLGERMVGAQRWAVILAAIGLVCVLGPGTLAGALTAKLIALSAGVAWAVSNIIAKQIQNREPMDLVSLTAWQMFFGSLLLCAMALFSGEAPTNWTPRFIAILIFTAAISTGLGWLAWLYLLKHLSAGVAALGTLAIPVVATCSSAYHFGERLNRYEMMGVVFIILALLVLARNPVKPAPTGNQ